MKISLVLIGRIKNGNANTFGTGILISFNSKAYIVTCKHVIFETEFENLFAIPNPRMTKKPAGGYKILSIAKVTFHPEDTDNESFDIAICELKHIPKSEFKKFNLSFVAVNQMTKLKEPKKGDNIIGYGYPIDYAEKLLALNKNDRLPPFTTHATVLDLPILQLTQDGFIGKLKEGFFAQTESMQDIMKGNSGGLVTLENNQEIQPYGVILGNAEIVYVNNGQKENYEGIVFAKFSRVIEILQTL